AALQWRAEQGAGRGGQAHWRPNASLNIAARVTAALPKITPLVLKRRAQAFDNSDWLFDLKYDGFRALLEINGCRRRARSRGHRRQAQERSLPSRREVVEDQEP